MRLRELLIAMLLSACHAPPPPQQPPESTEPLPTGPKPTLPQPSGTVDGQACTAGGQCASGVCEGEGCTDQQFGVCAPAQRACTRDLRQYCGCDGVTFSTSGSCPGRRYAHKGGC